MIIEWIWAVATVAASAIWLWAIYEAGSDCQFTRRSHLNPIAQQSARGDFWQEVMFGGVTLTAAVLATVVLLPIPALRRYVAIGLVIILALNVVMALRRRLNRRMMLRLVGINRSRGAS
jgi:Flp pilus assembly protein TadB